MNKLIASAYQHAVLCFFTWFCIIFVLCATPGEYIPSNNWLDLLSIDKLVHACMFFVLYIFSTLLLFRRKASPWLFTGFLIFCLLYGLSLEILQATFFRNRSADVKDMIANSTGCFVAWACLPALRKRLPNEV
jgi:hypothetical protein